MPFTLLLVFISAICSLCIKFSYWSFTGKPSSRSPAVELDLSAFNGPFWIAEIKDISSFKSLCNAANMSIQTWLLKILNLQVMVNMTSISLYRCINSLMKGTKYVLLITAFLSVWERIYIKWFSVKVLKRSDILAHKMQCSKEFISLHFFFTNIFHVLKTIVYIAHFLESVAHTLSLIVWMKCITLETICQIPVSFPEKMWLQKQEV